MSDKRTHRGAHPEDESRFARDAWPRLSDATHDLSWLLSREYATASAVKLVGDRYRLDTRQRLAVTRCACSDAARIRRTHHQVASVNLKGATILLDGYNVLTSVEAALGGGVILAARDGCFRDMASMHGTYRKVAETIPALQLIGKELAAHQVAACIWYLDSPVSNSGRLKIIMQNLARDAGWNWRVELIHNPDSVLAGSHEIIATADSMILDHSERWFNLARDVITNCVPDAWIVDLSTS